jgi:hypothetical protein
VTRFFRALVQVDRVLKHFRTRYLGKASPVHVFWGSFDMAVLGMPPIRRRRASHRRASSPRQAYYSSELSEFVLPYDAVRQACDPEATLTAFLQSIYNAAANLGTWDRPALASFSVPQ